VRTCVGCRERAGKTDLLRVVADGDRLVPDPAGRLPGRGRLRAPRPALRRPRREAAGVPPGPAPGRTARPRLVREHVRQAEQQHRQT
jgi:hypothetical protein